MENSLHFGIKKLKDEFELFKSMPFPEKPDDDELYDIFSELVELDGHIAGLVSSMLKGKKVNRELLYVDQTFNKLVDDYHPKSKEFQAEMQAYKDYKKKLDRLLESMATLV